MNDNVRTRLELLNDGLNMPKRQYEKAKAIEESRVGAKA